MIEEPPSMDDTLLDQELTNSIHGLVRVQRHVSEVVSDYCRFGEPVGFEHYEDLSETCGSMIKELQLLRSELLK
jgi:hypothetical protein